MIDLSKLEQFLQDELQKGAEKIGQEFDRHYLNDCVENCRFCKEATPGGTLWA